MTHLLDAVRAIDEARSLTAVLDALVTNSANDAARAGVLLVRADRVRGWRDDSLDRPVAETGLVAEAIRSGRATTMKVEGAAPPPFAGAAAGRDVHAFPLTLSGEIVAILYAEGGDAGALEILSRHAARQLEALTAFKTARAIASGDASLLAGVSAA
jgi:hypothetical protein